ncbi:MAG: type II toxin-antitoxin system RelE/ParE family toxin [Oscillospiraceae bacterium]|jgi:phage-related protein|nr:type II toxin-antitoxin system RelE/ParE family toxin [Oscillospiraceae bacterium]
MYMIEYYKTEAGIVPIRDWLDELDRKALRNKSIRIQRNKIIAYIDALKENGTWIGQPVTKHLNAEIWELRPESDRILYFFAKNNTFVLLHHFVKKTNATPTREIEQAKRNMYRYLERNK